MTDKNLNTRDLILDEAKKCFAGQGFSGTSLNDIAAGVGIRRPSLLHYFDSKEAIYIQVLKDTLTDWGLRINEACTAPLDGWELVNNGLEASFEFFRANPELVSIVRREALSDKSGSGIDVGAALQPFFQRAVSFFEREMDAGHFRRHDARQLVITGYGALLSYFSDASFLTSLLDSDPLSDEALEVRFTHVKEFFHAALEPESNNH